MYQSPFPVPAFHGGRRITLTPADLAMQIQWHVEGPRPYVNATMRNIHTGEFLAAAQVAEPHWWDRDRQVAAENYAVDFAARVALGRA